VLMLKRYGDKALEESATRADQLERASDLDGAAVPLRVLLGQMGRQRQDDDEGERDANLHCL
jgi:hypothetical protein